MVTSCIVCQGRLYHTATNWPTGSKYWRVIEKKPCIITRTAGIILARQWLLIKPVMWLNWKANLSLALTDLCAGYVSSWLWTSQSVVSLQFLTVCPCILVSPNTKHIACNSPNTLGVPRRQPHRRQAQRPCPLWELSPSHPILLQTKGLAVLFCVYRFVCALLSMYICIICIQLFSLFSLYFVDLPSVL